MFKLKNLHNNADIYVESKEKEVFMSGMSVGGLASGLDTNSIIAQLTALEQAKVTRESKKKDAAQETLTKFNDLETRLNNLDSKARALHSPENFNVFKALSNYEEYAVVSGGEGATAGQYELKVYDLATTQKVASNTFEKINEPIGSNTTITLSTSVAAQKTDSTKKEVDVVIEAKDTLKDIMNKINAAEGAGVKASMMTMSDGTNRLILTAVDTGTKGFYMKENANGNENTLLGDKLGIISDEQSKLTSSGSLLTMEDPDTGHSGVANGETTFDKIDTGLGKNKFGTNDVFNIKIKDGTGNDVTVSANIHDGTDYKTINTVLGELNTQLAGFGSDLTASLNSSGEIVLTGAAGNENFTDANIKGVEIKIGESKQRFNEDGTAAEDGDGNPILDFVTKKTLADNAQSKNNMSFGNVWNAENVINQAKNAHYTIDGMAIGSRSNSDGDSIMGTTFTLKKVSVDDRNDITIKTSLELDMDALSTKIAEFVEEFNSLLKFIDDNAKSTVKEETDETTGKKKNTRTVGAFTGDSNISGLRDKLRQMMSSVINEIANPPKVGEEANPKYEGYYTAYSSASRIGIITDKNGYFEVDKEKLTKALNADFEGVRRLFSASSFSNENGYKVGRSTKNTQAGTYEIRKSDIEGGDPEIWFKGSRIDNDPSYKVNWTGNSIVSLTQYSNDHLKVLNEISIEIPSDLKDRASVTFSRGIASKLSSFMEQAKSTVNGFFKSSKEMYQDRIDSIQDRVDQLQARVDNYNKRLVSQFSALERTMSNLQAQTANMMSALGGTYR